MYKYIIIYIHIKQRVNLERQQMGMHGIAIFVFGLNK